MGLVLASEEYILHPAISVETVSQNIAVPHEGQTIDPISVGFVFKLKSLFNENHSFKLKNLKPPNSFSDFFFQNPWKFLSVFYDTMQSVMPSFPHL